MGTSAWIGLAVLALVVIGLVVLVGRKAMGSAGTHRSKASVKGLGVSVQAESSSDVAPGVRVHEATSREGGLNAEDQSGRGVDLSKIDTRTDINVTNIPPPQPELRPKT